MAQPCPVRKLEKILVASDGSEFSSGAVREAINLSKQCFSKLFAMSVVETNLEFEALSPHITEKAEQAARQFLESIKDQASKEGVACNIIIHEGDEPYKFIVEEAAKNQVNMIIMGRRGRTGIKRLLMGSETAKTIGHAPCNVLVVPKASRLEFKNILLATDGSKHSDAAASEAANIAKHVGANLHIVSVIPIASMLPFDVVNAQIELELIPQIEHKAAEDNVRAAQAIAANEGVKAEGTIVSGSPYDAIVETANEKKADLIVVGSHGRTGVSRLLMGSVAERVIGHAGCAVMVVKL